MSGIVRQSLADRVFDHLVTTLATRKLRIGARLNARTITDELAVSRTTVNKAIERLVDKGWVKSNEKGRPVVAAYPGRKKVPPTGETGFDFSNQTDSTYEVILERVLRADYEPGEVLKERPLAAELKVNPATVRRAAEWLRNDGLLVRVPRRGWRVALIETRDVSKISIKFGCCSSRWRFRGRFSELPMPRWTSSRPNATALLPPEKAPSLTSAGLRTTIFIARSAKPPAAAC